MIDLEVRCSRCLSVVFAFSVFTYTIYSGGYLCACEALVDMWIGLGERVSVCNCSDNRSTLFIQPFTRWLSQPNTSGRTAGMAWRVRVSRRQWGSESARKIQIRPCSPHKTRSLTHAYTQLSIIARNQSQNRLARAHTHAHMQSLRRDTRATHT